MKLIGNLKKRVDKASDIEEKRSLIEEAGMKLTDDELNMVAGGGEGSGAYEFPGFFKPSNYNIPINEQITCSSCGATNRRGMTVCGGCGENLVYQNQTSSDDGTLKWL